MPQYVTSLKKEAKSVRNYNNVNCVQRLPLEEGTAGLVVDGRRRRVTGEGIQPEVAGAGG